MPHLVLLCLVLVCAAGCGSSDSALPHNSQAQQALAPAAEMVPRPEFANWSQFPVGTQATRVRTTTNANGTVLVTTRTKLLSKDDKKVVVETQIDVKRPGEELERNDPMTHEFTSSFALPAGMKAEQFSLPSMKAEKVGSEKFDLLDREYDSELYKWEDSSESGPIQCKLWCSNDIPGRVLRQEQVNPGAQFTSDEVVTELAVPKETELNGAQAKREQP